MITGTPAAVCCKNFLTADTLCHAKPAGLLFQKKSAVQLLLPRFFALFRKIF